MEKYQYLSQASTVKHRRLSYCGGSQHSYSIPDKENSGTLLKGMSTEGKFNISSATNLHLNTQTSPNPITYSKPVNLSFSRHIIRSQKQKEDDLSKIVQDLSTKINDIELKIDMHDSKLVQLEKINDSEAKLMGTKTGQYFLQEKMTELGLASKLSISPISDEIVKFENEISSIKKEVEQCVRQDGLKWVQVQLKSTNKNLQKHETSLNAKIENLTRHLSERIRLECQELKQQLESKLSETSKISTDHNIPKQQPAAVKKSSYKKMTGQTISIKHKTSLEVQSPNIFKTFPIDQTLYHIDQNGYLLDNDNNYLITSQGYKIKLEDKHLELLKQNNIIK